MSNGVKIVISDNGKGFTDDVLKCGYGKGIGMKNIMLRVNQLGQSKVLLVPHNTLLCQLLETLGKPGTQ